MQDIVSGNSAAAIDPLQGVVRALESTVGPTSAPTLAARRLLQSAQYNANDRDGAADNIRKMLEATLGTDSGGKLLLPGVA